MKRNRVRQKKVGQEQKDLVNPPGGGDMDELPRKYTDAITKTFRRVGLSLNPDGTEECKVQIKGWKRWSRELSEDEKETQHDEASHVLDSLCRPG